jgi:hypothetical protein
VEKLEKLVGYICNGFVEKIGVSSCLELLLCIADASTMNSFFVATSDIIHHIRDTIRVTMSWSRTTEFYNKAPRPYIFSSTSIMEEDGCTTIMV